MDIIDLIRSRRSIRAFDPEGEVSPESVDRLLEAARWAPSAGNVQPWRFTVVRDRGVKNRLAAAAYGQSFVSAAPVVIVASADLDEAEDAYRKRGRELYAIQDTAAAVQNILLAAHSLGFGTCWVGAFSESAVSEALDLSANQRPLALIPVGIPAENPPPPDRKPLRRVARGS